MRWLHQFAMLLKALFLRSKASKQLDDELQFHLEQQIAENLAAGMDSEEARHAALRSFGNPAALRDASRETWSWNAVEQFIHDLRIGIRTLTRTPGFALTGVLVMALGIGANIALFTIVRSVLLRPLPFKDPERLVALYDHGPNGGNPYDVIAPGDFYDWQRETRSFEQMAI